jgi:hypothetical protein
MEGQFNFLRMRSGRTYFARIGVVSDLGFEGVQLSATAGSQNPHTPEPWMEAAWLGADKARQAHEELGGGKIGLKVISVSGTEVDTTEGAIEVASYCAAWKALGHSETDLIIEFDDDWRVRIAA